MATPQDAFRVRELRRKPKKEGRESARAPQPPESAPSPPRVFNPILMPMLLAAIGVVVFGLLRSAAPALGHIALALVCAAVLNPVVAYLESWNFNRLSSVLVLFLLAMASGFVVLELLTPAIWNEARVLSASLPPEKAGRISAVFVKGATQILTWLRMPAIEEQLGARLQAWLAIFQQGIAAIAQGLLLRSPDAIVVALLAFFLLKDGSVIKRELALLASNHQIERAVWLTHMIVTRNAHYLRRQFFFVVGAGLLLTLAFRLLGMPNFLTLGAYAGLAMSIPYYGAILAAFPVIMLSAISTGSFNIAVAIIIALATVNLLKQILLSRYSPEKIVALHPLEVLLVLLIGGSLAGFWGLLLAAPVAGVAKIVLEEVSRMRKNFATQ